MANKYPTVKLGAFAESVSITHKFDKSEVIFLNTSDVYLGEILHKTYRKIENLPGQAKKTIKNGDILFSEIRPANGRWAFTNFSETEDFVVSTKLMVIRTKNENLHPKFLYYCLTSPANVAWLQVLAESRSGTFPQITFDQVAGLEVPLPPFASQVRIADHIDVFERKIALNRSINYTLEAMAQAIFKSWFIDFDPVKAKMAAIQDGRDPQRAAMIAISGKAEAALNALSRSQLDELAATAALFPDELEKSEFGEIPKGWLVRTLPECIDVNPSRTLRKGSVAPYLDMANVPTNAARVQNVFPREFASGSKFKNGDTLLARITPCLENGKTAFVDFLNCDEVGWGSTEFIVLRPKIGLPKSFAYFLCRDPDFRTFAIGQMAGTSGRQRVPNDCFGAYKMVEPSSAVGIEFDRLASAVLNQIKALDEEAKTLAHLRDTFMPKLLSGELAVTAQSEFAETV